MADQLTAGVAVRDIMPTKEMVNNALHCVMTVRMDELGSPLKTKTLALSMGDTILLLVVVDLCHLKQDQSNMIRQRIGERTGVPVDHIVVSCSHSHSTPFAEPLDGPYPFLDFVAGQATDAAVAACESRQPARIGFGTGHVVGASFNTRVPLEDGHVKFSRDFREGLATGRPIDPRVSMLRVDDEAGRPLAGWVRLALHPACVIFNAPLSAEFPGYMTDELTATVGQDAPFLFSLGACGDVNCVPMFGSEDDTRRLGLNLASWIGPMFESIHTGAPSRLLAASRSVDLSLDPPPSVEQLDREIAEVDAFCTSLDTDPTGEWVMGVNCAPHWTVEEKKKHVGPLKEWAEKVKQMLADGETFPSTWRSQLTTWVINDIGLVFYSGEPLVELGLELAARSPLKETLLMAVSNGTDGYVGTDVDRQRAGYETYTVVRYARLRPGYRPLPYALGVADQLIEESLGMIDELCCETAKEEMARAR